MTISKKLFRWMIVLAVLSPLAVTGLNIWYTKSELVRQQHQSDMRWCKLFDLYVDPTQPPPTTERGKQQLTEFRILYRALGCEDKA